MNTRQIPPTFAAYRGAHAAVLLALGMACTPALASSGVTPPCDEGARAAQGLDVPARELSIRTVDLGPTSSVTADGQSLDQPVASRSWAPPSLTLSPRADSTAKNIFDEPQFSPQSQLDSPPAGEGKSAPVADAITPLPGGDKIGQQDRADSRMRSEGLNGVSTRSPGVATDDLLRFKRRMYRTDI